MKIENKRGTDSLPSFTASTLDRFSAQTHCDEWMDSDTESWFEKTEKH